MKKFALLASTVLCSLVIAASAFAQPAQAETFSRTIDGAKYRIVSSWCDWDHDGKKSWYLEAEYLGPTNKKKTSYTIPATVNVKYKKKNYKAHVDCIDSYAFCGMTKLKSVTVKGPIHTVGRSAFDGCSNLVTFKCPKNSLVRIDMYAFSGCKKLKAVPSVVDATRSVVYVPEVRKLELDTVEIGGYAFEGCKALKKVSFAESGNDATESNERHAYVDAEAFAGCTGLESVSFEGGTYYLGEKAFSGCTKLKTITSVVTSFKCDSDVFLNCRSLENVWFEQAWVRSIEFGDRMFKGCESLTQLKIDGWVEYLWLGSRMFEGCDQLASLELSDSLTCIDRVVDFYEGAAYGEELEAQIESYVDQNGRYEPDWLYQ